MVRVCPRLDREIPNGMICNGCDCDAPPGSANLAVAGLLHEVELMNRFKELSNIELVQLAISDEFCADTESPIVEEMMRRLDPDWAEREAECTAKNGVHN